MKDFQEQAGHCARHLVWGGGTADDDAGSGGLALVAAKLVSVVAQTPYTHVAKEEKSCYPQETTPTKEARRVRGTGKTHLNRMFHFLL